MLLKTIAKVTKMTKFTNFQTVLQSLLAVKDSDAPKLCSSQCWSVDNCQVSTKSLTNQFWNATLISEKTCTTISLWVVEQLCSQVFLKDLASKLPLWPRQPWRWKCSLLKKESSWYGLVVQFYLHCQLSRQCGSQRQNIKRAEPKLSTENVSDKIYRSIYLLKSKYILTIITLEFLV